MDYLDRLGEALYNLLESMRLTEDQYHILRHAQTSEVASAVQIRFVSEMERRAAKRAFELFQESERGVVLTPT